MKDTITKNIRYILTGTLMASSLLVASVAFAAGPDTAGGWGHGKAMAQHMPGVFGTVTAINGSTITIDSKGFGPNATETTYTVDASGATVTKDQNTVTVGNIAVGDMISVQGTVNGDTVTATAIRDGLMGRGMGQRGSGVFGTVTAINGSVITLESKGRGQDQTQTTYTVNTNGATVTKDGATVSLNAIAVNDMIMVQGTVSGDAVTATAIHDGMPQGAPDTIVTGNGQPVIGGTVSAVNGSTLTITNKSNVTYTVDASSATIEKDKTTSSVSNIAVGDNVIVQGTVNGNSVSASSVIDSGMQSTTGGNATSGNVHHDGMGGMFGGFFGGMGGFLHSLFGFF